MRKQVLDQDGDARAASVAQDVARRVATPKMGNIEGLPGGVGDIEGLILERLPMVCGRLLVVFQQRFGIRQSL